MVGVPSATSPTSSQSYGTSNTRPNQTANMMNNQDHMRLSDQQQQQQLQQQQQQQSISQMRSSINEKRLLVKLLKANNLTSKMAY